MDDLETVGQPTSFAHTSADVTSPLTAVAMTSRGGEEVVVVGGGGGTGNVTDMRMATSKMIVKHTTVVFYLVTFVFGLFGNSLVMYVVARFEKVRRRSVSNYYIWNLALADELFVLTLPFFCYVTYTGDWIFGASACRILYVFRESNKFASVFTLAALSADRYLAT